MPRRATRDITQTTFTDTISQMNVDPQESDEENSIQNFDLLVNNLVKFVINNSSNKLPLKRNEISKELNISQKSFPKVFQAAKELLSDIYGMDLVEVSETKGTKSFMTVSKIKLSCGMMVNSEAASEIKMLFIILSYIFMKSGEVQEVNLNNFLESLNINLEEFSKTKDKFVRQLYLKRRKNEVEGKNEAITYYSWGERATLEFDKREILESVAKLTKKSPSNFITQYREIYGETDAEDTIMVE